MLTLAEANQVIAGALAKAQSMKTKIAVSVCDQGGHLLAFQRMDGAFLESVAAAIGKAIGAAASRKSSGDKGDEDDVLDLQSVWRVAGAGLPANRPRPGAKTGHQIPPAPRRLGNLEWSGRPA